MKYIKTLETFDEVQYRNYMIGDKLKYIDISKNNWRDNWYKLVHADNVNVKGSLLGKIVNVDDPSDSKYEYLYKMRPVTEVDINAKKYNI